MFVNAFNATTGEPVRVPEHWVDHPVLGVNLTLKAPKPDPEIQATIATKKPTATVPAQTPKN